MKLWKKILYALSWVPMIFVKVFLALLGLIMVPVCLGIKKGNFSGMFWLWGNDEEGCPGCPEWWLTRCANGEENKVAEWFPRFWWYAVRNPVNNFRFLFEDRAAAYSGNWFTDLPMEAQQLLDAGQDSAYMWAYNGPFAGYRKVWLHGRTHYSEIWIGWKVGSVVPGMGFAMQYRRKREIGT